MAIEYRAIRPPQELSEVEPFLNGLGASDWELCEYTKGGLAIFKRAVVVPALGLWNFQTTIAPPPPSGGMRFNNGTQDNATLVYVSSMSAESADLSTAMTQALKAGKKLRVVREANESQFKIFNITADATVVTGTPNHFEIAVSLADAGGNISVGMVKANVE